MAILSPKPERQEHDMRVRGPSGGCDVHRRTLADAGPNLPQRRLNEAAGAANAARVV